MERQQAGFEPRTSCTLPHHSTSIANTEILTGKTSIMILYMQPGHNCTKCTTIYKYIFCWTILHAAITNNYQIVTIKFI